MPFGVSRAVIGSRVQYVVVSDGAGDAGRPVALNELGKLDITLIDASTLLTTLGFRRHFLLMGG